MLSARKVTDKPNLSEFYSPNDCHHEKFFKMNSEWLLATLSSFLFFLPLAAQWDFL